MIILIAVAGCPVPDLQCILEEFLDFFRCAGLGNEIDRAQRARMPRVALPVLTGQHEYPDRRRVCQQFCDQVKAFVGSVRNGRQSQINQRQLRGA